MKGNKSKHTGTNESVSASPLGEDVPEVPAWKRQALHRVAEKIFPSKLCLPYDDSGLDSYRARLDRQRNWFMFVLEQCFEMMVTIQFNESLTEAQFRARVKRFDAFLNRYFLGRKWASFKAEDRVFFLAFGEANSSGSHVHAHILLRRPQGRSPFPVRIPSWKYPLTSKQWTDACRKKYICPHGDIDVRGFDEYSCP